MRSKVLLACSIIVMGLAITLNFGEMLMGSPAGLLNAIATTCYILFWTAFMALARESKELLVYSSVIGGVTLMMSLLTLAINVYGWDMPAAIPLVAIFLTPFYGIGAVFDNGFVSFSIAMAFISATWFISSMVLHRRTNRA